MPIIILIIFCLFTFPAHSATTNESDELKQKMEELQKIQTHLQDAKQKLKITKIKQQEVMGKLVVINKNLVRTKNEFTATKNKLTINEARLGQLEMRVADGMKRLSSRNTLLQNRIKEIYKNGGINYLELLLTANTLSDFVNRSYFFEKIMGRDIDLFREVKEEYEKLKKNKTNLEETTTEIRFLARLIENKKNYMETQAKEKEEIYNQLESRRQEYEKRIIEEEQTSKEIENLIEKILAERKKKGLVSPQGSGNIIWPLRGRITSNFGYRRNPFWRGVHMHTGTDIAAPYGSPIVAADGGEVILSGWLRGYGKVIIIDHGKGISTVYAHLSRIYLQQGQTVSQGQSIGLVGNTGWSTGPHLHFEVRVNGTPKNPMKWLPK